MKIQSIDISSISQEKTFRQDFDYHQYHKVHSDNYYTFKELFELIPSAKTEIDALFCDFKYCEIGDVDKNGDVFPISLNFSRRNLIDEDYYKKIEKGDIISVGKDNILIAKVRPNLRKYIRITDSLRDIYFTSAFIQIRPKIMPEIMYYCLRSLFHKDLIAISRQGKGYPTLSENDISTLRFDRKTIDLLRENETVLKNQILKNEKQIKDIVDDKKEDSDIIDSVFAEEFNFDYGKFIELKNVKIFEVKHSAFSNNPDMRFSAKFHRHAGEFVMQQLLNLSDKKIKHFLSEPIVLGASVSPDDYSDDGDYYYLSMATIKNWHFNKENANTVSTDYSAEKQEKTVQKDDIIFARSGEGTIGKVALIDEENINGIFADFTMRIRLKDYNPLFAYYYFRTTYFQYLVEVYKKGLGNNTNIFPIVIQEFPIPDISLQDQNRIVEKIQTEIEKQKMITNKISSLRKEIYAVIGDIMGSKGVANE